MRSSVSTIHTWRSTLCSKLHPAHTYTALPDVLDPATLERLTRAITASGRFQLVERSERRPHYHKADGTATKVALYLDVETTGTDPARHKIIQLACTPFSFDPLTGRVFEVSECEVWFEDPGEPVPPEITELTGITDQEVAGHRIDDARACTLLSEAVLVIAHNASFDRRFLERRLPLCQAKHWACSRSDVPWDREGLGGTKLAWLAYRQCRMFYEEHRADSDCLVGIHLLTTTAEVRWARHGRAFTLGAAQVGPRVGARKRQVDARCAQGARIPLERW